MIVPPQIEGKNLIKLIFWLISIGTGLILPWSVGIGVKLYLQAIGKPTVPWSYFLSPGSILLGLPLSLWFASPFIGLAFFGRHLLSAPSFIGTTYWERLIILLCGLLAGAIGTVRTFLCVFWEFDPLYLILVPHPVFYLPYIVVGVFGGIVITKLYVILLRKDNRSAKS
jgi:hypothetical protein